MLHLTDEQRALREEVATFARTRVRPVADRLDRQRQDIPWDLLDELAGRGYFGLTVPERHGGRGLGMVGYCLAIEALARAWLSVASVVGRGNALLDEALITEEDRGAYLPRVAAGRCIGAFALSEAQAGSDVAELACRARETRDGWVIEGDKKWCGFARRADVILLFARTDDAPADAPHLGISQFLIDKERDAFPAGLTGEPVDKIGYHGLTTWSLRFDGLEVPRDALKGERGEAFYGIMAGLDRKRIYTAARAVGLAQGALEDATRYARDREQFDHELADFQAIRFTLADMATQVSAARAATLSAAAAFDAGEDITREAAIAKLFATEAAERVTSAGLQVHGGNGYTHEYAAQRYWRDARLTTIFEGTSEIQRRIIADHVLEHADDLA